MASPRAKTRELVRDIEDATRKRFGKHVSFKIYCDTSDGDENEFDACLHHVRVPAEAKSAMMFPHNDKSITAKTKHEALQGLLDAIRKA